MAKFSDHIIILVAFFLATTIAKKPNIPALETAYQCQTYFGQECGVQVYDRIFGTNVSDLPINCCYKLVQMGYPCHTRLTVSTGKSPNHVNEDLKVTLAKSDIIYDKCDEATYPGNILYLASCIDKIGTDCGDEVSKYIVFDGNVSKQCCQKLVKTGQDCNDNLAKALIRIPELRNEDATQIIERGKKIFQQCQKSK
ncbi:putative Prolamin-like domain-containing protein [Lupinus albus]|uniref:Putative Prolamin-like domain-containing protein n=1 Tax=Lupinus albus TaxID=3870 RepID=A0A6A4NQD1_LUPAL|nr:putative Prolamin-like domain-containing protein [Lupinus albus]